MKFKNFIWDFDGTLAETYYHTTTAFCKILNKYGIFPEFDEAIFEIRKSFENARKVYGVDEKVFKEFSDYADNWDYEPLPYAFDESADVLSFIHENGGKNYLFTNRNHSALVFLEKLNLLKYFDDTITSEHNCFEYKPSPSAINFLIENYSLDRSQTVMIGDRPVDIKSGKNAGCAGILFDRFDLYQSIDADAVIKNLSEIKKYI